MELDDILDESAPNEVIEKPEEVAPEVEKPEEQPRDETGKFAQKGEEESESPSPVETPPLEHPALIGERRRRQEAEQSLKALQEQMQQPKEPPPTIWEDENAWQQNFGGQVIDQAVSQATYNSKLDMSEMLTRQANPDFDEVREKFLALADENPALRQQALADPHPWNKAYQIAKNHETMKELGATDLTTLRAELRKEIEADMAKKPAPQIPNSLANDQSSRAPAVGDTGPMSLEDILK